VLQVVHEGIHNALEYRFYVDGHAYGLLLCVPVNRLLGSMLVGVEPVEPVAFVSASLALVATALCAAYLPARRASKVDPVVALRND
jgi:ABC-type lipoprotein release transport system permease subunit